MFQKDLVNRKSIDLLKKAIKKDIAGEKYIKEWKWQPGVSDRKWTKPVGLERYLGRPLPISPNNIEVYSTIANRFKPIMVSREKLDDYRIAYVFPDEDPPNAPKSAVDIFEAIGHRGVLPVPVNLKRLLEDEKSELFLPPLLADKAHETREEEQSQCYLICAERGAGKTAFIGYLFSVHHEIFFKKRVAWVRMDVSHHLPQLVKKRQTLFSAFCTHALWVLLEHYLRPSFGAEVKKHKYQDKILTYGNFIDWCMIKGEYWPSWLNGLSNPEDIEDVIDNIHIYPDKEKKRAFKLFCEFMRDNGYAFIFIIDGLDNHSVALVEQRHLDIWLKEIDMIVTGNKQWPRGLYLLCLREGTYKYYRDMIRTNISMQGNMALRMVWDIAPVNPNRIIEQRKKLVTNYILRLQKLWKREKKIFLHPKMAESLIELTQEAIKDILIEARVKSLIEEVARSGYLKPILEFFREALMVVIGVAENFFKVKKIENWIGPSLGKDEDEWWDKIRPYLNDLKKELNSKTYLLWSAATFSPIHYADQPIKVQENTSADDEELLHTSQEQVEETDGIRVLEGTHTIEVDSISGDMPLMPNPWADLEYKTATLSPTPHYLLLKLMIVQYLSSRVAERGRASEEAMPEAGMEEIIKDLRAMFGYDPSKISDYIKCMILERILRFSRLSLGLKAEETAVTLSFVGEKALKEWITNANYIEHTIQLSVIPDNLIDHFERFPTPGTPIDIEKMEERLKIEYSQKRPQEVQPSHYLPKLFRTWAKFIALLKLMSRWLEFRYRAYRVFGAFEGLNTPFEPSFNFIEKLQKDMNRTVDKIVHNAYMESHKKILQSLLKEYKTDMEQLEARVN